MEGVPLEWLLVGLIVLTLLTLFLYLAYSGMFSPITVSTLEPDMGPIVLAYKTQTGPYKDAGEIFTESYCLLPDREQLGIYYDDPEAVPSSELRCAVGPVLAKGDEEPIPEEMEKMKNYGFKILHLPKPSYVVTASFPFTTTLSIYLGIYRVYPRLRDYISERKLCAYPALEVYTDSSIIFMMPLSRQDEFFVSEFQDDEMSIATTDVGEIDKESNVSTMTNELVRQRTESALKNSDNVSGEELEEVDSPGGEEEGEEEKKERDDSADILTGPLTRD